MQGEEGCKSASPLWPESLTLDYEFLEGSLGSLGGGSALEVLACHCSSGKRNKATLFLPNSVSLFLFSARWAGAEIMKQFLCLLANSDQELLSVLWNRRLLGRICPAHPAWPPGACGDAHPLVQQGLDVHLWSTGRTAHRRVGVRLRGLSTAFARAPSAQVLGPGDVARATQNHECGPQRAPSWTGEASL